jgi:hypothetical protein
MPKKQPPPEVAEEVKELTEVEEYQREIEIIMRELHNLKQNDPKKFAEKRRRLMWLIEQRDLKK